VKNRGDFAFCAKPALRRGLPELGEAEGSDLKALLQRFLADQVSYNLFVTGFTWSPMPHVRECSTRMQASSPSARSFPMTYALWAWMLSGSASHEVPAEPPEERFQNVAAKLVADKFTGPLRAD
jgi:hypothetical protein